MGGTEHAVGLARALLLLACVPVLLRRAAKRAPVVADAPAAVAIAVAPAVVAPTAPLPAARAVARRGHGPRHAAASVCLALALLCLAGLATARVTGHVVLADRSDSMRPAIAAGDLLLVRSVRAATVRRGDVVTFSDPTRDGASITHRVVSGRARDGRIDFVTRGDANAAVERWSIDGADRVGRLAVVIPRAGHVADALAGRDARLFGVALVALLGALYIRRIWSEP